MEMHELNLFQIAVVNATVGKAKRRKTSKRGVVLVSLGVLAALGVGIWTAEVSCHAHAHVAHCHDMRGHPH